MFKVKTLGDISIASLLVAFSVLISLVIGEVFVRYEFYSAQERRDGAESFWREYNNEYLRPSKGNGCVFSETLQPHPYLSYVHTSGDRCSLDFVNNRGIMSIHDIPFQRDDEHYSILVTGGSVASHLSFGAGNDGIWLEDFLNHKYLSPNGKPFRVIGGALGGWSMPNQVIAAALYSPYVDAIIEVDGYNEAIHSEAGLSIDTPDFNTFLFAIKPTWGLRSIGMINALIWSRRHALENKLVKKSFLAFTIWRRLMSVLPTSPVEAVGPLAKHFELPEGWSVEFKANWNKERFKSYIRQAAAIARSSNVKYAEFLQPIPQISKPLSDFEKKLPVFVSPKNYSNIFIAAISDLTKEKYPVFSLVNVFEGHPETLYSDHIHCKFDSTNFYDNPGYKLISEKIAVDIASAWKLRSK